MTTAEAATYLGVNSSRIRQMILREGLPAQKYGRDWLIRETDLAERKRAREAQERRPGRPYKTHEAG